MYSFINSLILMKTFMYGYIVHTRYFLCNFFLVPYKRSKKDTVAIPD